MDPRDRLEDLLADVACAACRRRVPAERIQLLAHRDDLAFLEIDCASCGSVSLGMLVSAAEHDADPADVDGPIAPRARPIDESDVAAMHAFLATWSGDLRTLVDGPPDGFTSGEPGG